MRSNSGIKPLSFFVFSLVTILSLSFATRADPWRDLKSTFENHQPLKIAPTNLRLGADASLIREMAQEDSALAYFVVGLPDIVAMGFSGSGSMMTRVPVASEDIVCRGSLFTKALK